MDLFAILGIGALIRLLRRGRNDHSAPSNTDVPFAPYSAPISPRLGRGDLRLLLRALRGLALAALLVIAALEPWPTAWSASAFLVPYAHGYKLWALRHVDVITVASVVSALLEPLLLVLLRLLRTLAWRLWRGLCATPRALATIANICRLLLTLLHWRLHCRRLRQRWEHLSLPIETRFPISIKEH
jgi:hypothetical protein